MKNYLNTIIISATIIITAFIFANAFQNRNSSNDIVNVTGLGKKDFTSDFVVWSGTFSRKNMDLKSCYVELNKDRETIKNYLISKGINEKEIIFFAIDINKEFASAYDKNGNSTSTFTGYRLTQKAQIESQEVDKVENVSREVTELINSGVEFSSNPPEYYYTKLAELKIEMIAAATEDARLRAENIAQNSGGKLGKVRYASMGIFQIVAQNSSEDYSWGGTFNTASKRKTATITMKLQYEVN